MMVIILVLFSLVCVTWVVSARQFQDVSTASASLERYDEGFEDLLREAFMQVIRGSNNTYSAIGPHSLLEDKYGNDRVDVTAAFGLISAARYYYDSTPQVAPDLTEIVVTGPAGGVLSPLNDYYNGRILTFVADANPAVVGHSVRIVDYNVVPNGGTVDYSFLIESFPTSALSPIAPPLPTVNTAGYGFIINGREFNGQGFTLMSGGTPFFPNQGGPGPGSTPADYDLVGGYNANGADESYDIPDWNNMILAGRVWDSVQQRWRVLLPSMHRPAFLNFAVEQGATLPDARNLMFRPSTDPNNGHPAFFANNQQLSQEIENLFSAGAGNTLSNELINNPNLIAYDVDNDGDGEADSVWLDLGMQAQTAPDGRMYKPLFALLVEDLDSRLNVNHHGTQELDVEKNPTAAAYLALHNTGPMLPPAVPGLGEGPADVNLLTYLRSFENNPGEATQSYIRMLYGNSANPLATDLVEIEGRYGEIHRSVPPTGTGADYQLPSPGINSVHDMFSAIVNNDVRNWRRRFGTAPDMRAIDRLGVAIDGQMRQAAMGLPGVLYDPHVDNPYEFVGEHTRKLSGGGALFYEDRPFTAGELELLLRYADGDVRQAIDQASGFISNPTGLEERLADLLQLSLNTGTPFGRRVQAQLTTHSADSPAPNVAYPVDMRLAASFDPNLQALIDAVPSPSVIDLLKFRLAQADPTLVDPMDPMYPQRFIDLTNATISNFATGSLLSPDLLAGTRMNINRPFGNGRDDYDATNNIPHNRVIDEGHNANMTVGSPYYDPSVVGAGAAARPDLIGEMNSAPRDPANPVQIFQPAWEFVAETGDLAAAGVPLYPYNQFYNSSMPFGYPAYSVVLNDLNYNGHPPVMDPTMAGSPPADTKEHLARHMYSRHLFALMMMLQEQEPNTGRYFQFAPNGSPAQMAGEVEMSGAINNEFTTYRIAQWAANCADYLDRDSIMSAFEYDAQPFVDNDGNSSNGTWDVDGDITTNETLTNPNIPRRVIWGMERPTMLLDETWAFHDVRTRDTDDDPSGEYTTRRPSAGMVDIDPHYDQTRMPQGSVFFELFCAVNGVVPAELRPEALTPWGNQRVPENVVDLSRLAPPGMDDPNTMMEDETLPRPVWRMVVAARNDDPSGGQISLLDPTNPVGSLRPTIDTSPLSLQAPGSSVQPIESPDDADISRIVWFTSWDAYVQQTSALMGSPYTPEDVDLRIYYSDLQLANAGLPDDERDFGNVVNWGFEDPGTQEAAMRMFHVAPSQYAVVGPRVTTKIGHSFPDAFMGMTEDKGNETVIQLLNPDLVPDAVGNPRPVAPVSDTGAVGTGIFQDLSVGASPDFNASYKSPDWTNTNNQLGGMEEQQRFARRPVGIVINGPRVPGGVGRRRGRGFSISEPDPATFPGAAGYYDQPDDDPTANVPAGVWSIDTFDWYDTPRDQPFDGDSGINDNPLAALKAQQPDGAGPFAAPYVDADGPKSLFLQRLANPLAPYHAVYNPYITVDMMDLDLSVYNGEEPLDHPDQTANPPEILTSRQKTGDLFDPSSNALSQEFSIWGYAATVDYLGNANPRANREVLHSLGHINGLYNGGVVAMPANDHYMDGTVVPGVAVSSESGTQTARASHAAGLAEHIAFTLIAEENPAPSPGVPSDRVANGTLQGDPRYQATLALAMEQSVSNIAEWANLNGSLYGGGVAPPANETGPGGIFIGAPLDTMGGEVPPSFAWNDRPFISAFDLMNVPATSAERFSRDFSTRSTNVMFDPYDPIQVANQASFRHLLNFFQRNDGTSFANFYHLFEYVHVPSRFPESQKLLNPAIMANIPASPAVAGNPPLYPPFNMLSKFREPGKVNLNDIFATGEVFGATLNDQIDPNTFEYVYNGRGAFFAMRDSRKGHGNQLVLANEPNPQFDLEFDPNGASFFGNAFKGFSSPDINDTFLRPLRNDMPSNVEQPLLAGRTPSDSSGVRAGSNPVIVGNNAVPTERDGDRHAYFRHEPLTKLGNIMTTRSNVYAV